MPAPVISNSVARRRRATNCPTLQSFIPNFTRERKHALNCETHRDKNNKRERVLRWHHHFCFVSSAWDDARPAGVDELTLKSEEEKRDCKFSLRGQNRTVICLKCVQLLGRFSHSTSCHTHTHTHESVLWVCMLYRNKLCLSWCDLYFHFVAHSIAMYIIINGCDSFKLNAIMPS